jgi:O-antigen/teichoic acid export membrane protein
MLHILFRNIASVWMGFATESLLRFFLTPFIIHALGDFRYGMWALIMGLTGYCGLLDLGFRAGLTQYLARHLATNDNVKLNEAASTAFATLLCCGLLVAIATALLIWLAPVVLGMSEDSALEMRYCLLILGGSLAIQFAFYPFAAIFPAAQQHYISNAVVVATRVGSGVSAFVVLKMGWGLVGLSLARVVWDQILYLSLTVLAYHRFPNLIVSLRLANRRSLWPMLRFGSWSFLAESATQLKQRVDPIIIGIFVSLAAITPYSLGLSLTEYFEKLFVPIGFVVFPLMTHLDARGDIDTTRRVYLSGSKMMYLLAITAGFLSAVWADDFFRLWVGPDIASGGTYASPAFVYTLLVMASVCSCGQRIGWQVMLGARRADLLARFLVCEGVLKVALSVALVGEFGLVGVAVGTLFPSIIFQVVIIPLATCRFLQMPAATYFRVTMLRPLCLLVCEGAILGPMKWALPQILNWPQLIVSCAVMLASAGGMLVLVGLNRAEWDRFLVAPASQIARRIGWITKSE